MQTRRDELDTLLGLGVLFFLFFFLAQVPDGGEMWSPGIMHTVELSKSFFVFGLAPLFFFFNSREA